MLERLLRELAAQDTANRFTIDVVVVDNDTARTAEPVVKRWAAASARPVLYDVEPEQNISRARNRAVLQAAGEFVVFVDDDEFPGPGWLRGLFDACREYAADGVLGPVNPHFETPPPAWLTRSGLCERARHATGMEITRANQMRTGNVLLRKSVFGNAREPFDPAFGETGGEDADFFGRALKRGARFVWCDEAPVFETVPPARWTVAYHVRRALLQGKINRNLLAKRHAPPREVAARLGRSALAVTAYAALMPVAVLRGRHVAVRYLVKACHHAGLMAALLGLSAVGDRAAIAGPRVRA
jgi:succinoglycan biosynthesis protein ExoM